ncbi:NDP-sugar synthase [Kitasatospora sp. NBC_01287]|uniref:NDP-sugar synthase n=1 Tax=Kitasatospora sp. NBC_01287 TaxID=2903573 RepID=UPI0022540345|nr:NDP-sugar synthase [Kitasatospora sp. NBC_01287]MCX4748305.1 NDP-sugar synthase [Kitasatospora sp. NBC_01287]
MGTGTVGIILAGGRGERAKPITLESADYIRSKALIPFVGRRLIEWVIDACREQGIRRFYVVAQGLENRSQIMLLIGHGERYGVEVRYSRPSFDRYNVGSGAATLHNLEEWDLTEQALVLPVDSIFDFSLAELAAAHRAAGAVVTVAAVARTPAEVAGKYGAMQSDARGLVSGFVEKPDAARIRELFPEVRTDADAKLPTNAGMYLVDCARLRQAAREPELMRQAQQRLDWGGDLLPYLVGRGLPVAAHPIARLGDLGNVEDYLITLKDVLAGDYPLMNELMAAPHSASPRYWIHESSLATRDDITGTTLADKIEEGSVVIGPGVRIGRHVAVGTDVHLEYADVGDGVELREGARLARSSCGDASVIGPYAEVSDTYVGPMVEIQSDRENPVRLESFSAIGDGAQLWPGCRLSGVSVYPRLRVPAIANLPAGTSLTSSDDILRWV